MPGRVHGTVLALLVLGAAGDAAAQYQFESKFGSFGTGAGQFNDPHGVVVDGSGQIIIVDSDNDRAQVCSDTGLCTTFGSGPGTLSGEFDKPRGVAVNSSDLIFIADRGNNRIQSCNEVGSCDDFDGAEGSIGAFESPRGVAIDGSDQLVIADTDNNRIQICNDTGTSCTGFGSLGAGTGQFNSPTGVAVDSQGRIIVADRNNNRIQVCTTLGSCTAFGGPGSAAGQFDSPSQVAVDSQDQIIVADRFNDRIQICSDSGSCTTFGGIGSGDGQFDLPWGVAVDAADRIIVADSGNSRIQIFTKPTAPPVSIDSFTRSAAAILTGETVTLSWAVSNATACTALGGTPAWTAITPDASAGNAMIQIDEAGQFTFTLECTDGDNTVSANVLVSVTEEPVVAIDSFTGSAAAILTGETVTLSWTVSNATACTALGGTPAWTAITPDASAGNAMIQIDEAGQFTFTLECTDGDNTVSANVLVSVTAADAFLINAGLNDAWFNSDTAGQGFFIIVFKDTGIIFLAWFTYDTERPDEGVTAMLGEAGHRWLTAQGPFDGDTALLDIFLTEGGVFDSVEPQPAAAVDVGDMTIVWHDCERATLTYNFPDLGLMGQIELSRIVPDNVALCQALIEP